MDKGIVIRKIHFTAESIKKILISIYFNKVFLSNLPLKFTYDFASKSANYTFHCFSMKIHLAFFVFQSRPPS